ncbi:MAG: hypothetical protein ABIH72_05180 [archaeon]
MKRGLIAGVFFIVLLASLVSAQLGINLAEGSANFAKILQDAFGPALSILFGSGEYIFERFLLFLIVLAVVFVVLDKVPAFQERMGVIWIIAFAVAILSTRFLSSVQTLYGIILPYGVLGVALTSLLPMLIFFYFVESFTSPTVRKLAWVLFAVVFFGLWIEFYPKLGNIVWIYFATGILALILFLADGTVRRALRNQEMAQLGDWKRIDYERKIRKDMDELNDDLIKGRITKGDYYSIKRRLKSRLKSLRKL